MKTIIPLSIRITLYNATNNIKERAMKQNEKKEILISGIVYPSITDAARFIVDDSDRGQVDTVRREIRRRHLQNGDVWLMYGEYLIGA